MVELAVGELADAEGCVETAALELASDELAPAHVSFHERAVVAEGAVLEHAVLAAYIVDVFRRHLVEHTVHELAPVPFLVLEIHVAERHVLEDLLRHHGGKLLARLVVGYANLDHFSHG